MEGVKQAFVQAAIRQATAEVIAENRAEIMRRARAKLVAMGQAVEADTTTEEQRGTEIP